jgi:hypothetical protein
MKEEPPTVCTVAIKEYNHSQKMREITMNLIESEKNGEWKHAFIECELLLMLYRADGRQPEYMEFVKLVRQIKEKVGSHMCEKERDETLETLRQCIKLGL